MAHRYRYALSERDYQTLRWLATRGYDAGLWLLSRHDCDDECEGRKSHVFSLGEPEAWEWLDAIKKDPHAYLTCCGSPTLMEALARLEDSIV